ncbi:MAG: hypothetical protein PHT69_07285 [Bacteroidales bacterium]|nr:hypothetical protein [Bacteroidales bacterium]
MRYTFLSLWILFVALLILFSYSCKPHIYAKEIAYIDSLLGVIDSSEIKLNEVDTAEISRDYIVYTENLSKIRDSFTEKDEESWTVFTHYGLIRKPLRDFSKFHGIYTEEIRVSREQLTTLRQNIVKKKIEHDLIVQYINDEVSFVEYISLSVDNLIENTTTYHEQFKELNPKVEELIKKNEQEVL